MTSSGRLGGVRVVVTRAVDAGRELRALLEEEGAETILFPLIAISDPESFDEVDRAVDRLVEGRYAWVAFTSANAAERFLSRALPRAAAALTSTGVAAVGGATRRMLDDLGVEVDLVPDQATGEALVAALGAGDGAGVLVPRVDDAPRDLIDSLAAAGWRPDEVTAYRNVLPDRPVPPEIGAGRFDAILLASGSAARNLTRVVDVGELAIGSDAASGPLVVCIGPSTATSAAEVGLRVSAVATRHDSRGLVDALVEALDDAHGTIGA